MKNEVLADFELKNYYQRLQDVLGIGSSTFLSILLELGDFRRFQKWQSMDKFCRVIPTVERSKSYDLIKRCFRNPLHSNRNTLNLS
ncbi:transposase [Candidatus Harpocratesius sp.]